jgi:hypothetical protein
MTSQDQPGWPSQDDHDPPEETQRVGDRSSRSRRKSRSPQAQRKSRWIGIGLSVAVLAGAVAAVISITTSGSNQTAASDSSVPGAAAGTASPGGGTSTTASGGGTSTAKGKVISAAKLAEKGGALSVPANMQNSVAQWQSGAGGRDLTAVSSQLGRALQAMGVKQYSPARYACAQLASKVVTAKAAPQIPDTAMQNLYTKALTELAKGAADCQAAISIKPTGDETQQTNVDTAKLHQSSSELSAGATDIFRATAEIEIISRQHH